MHNNKAHQIALRERQSLLYSIKLLSDQTQKTELFIIKTLSSLSCERRIKRLLEDSPFLEEKADLYYRQRSRFAQIKILDHLKSRLMSENINATLLTEFFARTGRYDIVVVGDEGRAVRIEVKTGFGIDFEQLDRYLWWQIPLILVRVPTNNVLRIAPNQLLPYTLFTLRVLRAKAERLISGKIYMVPGLDCLACTCFDCPYNKGKMSNCRKRMSDEEFEEELILFFKNLPYVAVKTAKLVIDELRPSQTKSFNLREELDH